MIYCIIGKSSSGKNAVFNRLRNHPSLQPIVTTTSRPIRDGEKQGYDYNFVSPDDFIDSLESNEFMEHTTYHVASGDIWFYGTKWDEFKDKTKHKVIVVNPSGFSSLVNTYGNREVVGIVIDRDERSRAISYLQRDENASLKELVRRFEADDKDFRILNGLHFSNIYHVQNVTGEFDKCVSQIEKIIGGYVNE